ncbi:RHS repeat protein [Paenibacillus jilunlii]|uniref:YD repeat-containing protein n=1 Tax=Paenibacillus jilunlii TaxID=682956 RepID=A0A1G9S5U5_9BACL|nr:RHS repeat protein [Paenibacillus jilunlii]KWX77769.1 hypothetical protein AML91_07050 [Paenibacillus jilunlii]SDM30762.1 YD repeat-containing protein [Paenibacillus jilunlii]
MKFTFNRCIFIFGIALFMFLDVTSNSALAMKSYFYDTNGRLVQESALTGETIRYSYDQNGSLISKSSGESFFQYLSAFSSEQGQSNWYYQIWNGTRYEDMTWDAVESRWKGKKDWDIISKEWMHPDGNDVALKWVAPQTGSIRITGKVAKHPINLQGDGVRVKIMKNNTQVWPASGWQNISGNDSVGVTPTVNVNVTIGDTLYFIVNQNGNNGYDATTWNPVITYIEKFSSAFSSQQGRNNWYYQTWSGMRYEDMAWDAAESRWQGGKTWNIISKEWMHPDGDVALKWVAPQTGSIRITGKVAKHPINLQGDGVRVKIMKNSAQVWPASGWQSINGDDSVGVAPSINVNVTIGDSLYFIVNQNGNNGYDGTAWNPAIIYIEKFSSAFSTEQGRNNWYYQIWNGTRYEDMTWNAVESRWRGKKDWDIISKEWMHPDGNDAALKWVAPQTGSIRITGKVAKHPINLQGDGVRVKIMKNNTQVWPASGWQSISGDDAVGVTPTVNVNVTIGDSLYFIVNQNGNNGYDGTTWNPAINYIN